MSTFTGATYETSKSNVIAITALVHKLEWGMERVWIYRLGKTNGVKMQFD
jgi:hypothetical protein